MAARTESPKEENVTRAVQRLLELSKLDPSQQRFCTSPERSIRLLAPAGSGKTHCLLWRCYFLSQIASDQNSRFLVVTFTRAARDELRARIKAHPVLSSIESSIEISTLNSWGFRRLKNRTHNLKLCATDADKYFCLNNLLQPYWQKHPAVRAALTSKYASHKSKEIMELFDALKALGFRHDLHISPTLLAKHVEWLKECRLEYHLLSVIQRLIDLEIVPSDVHSKSNAYEILFENFVQFWIESTQAMFNASLITLEDQKYWAMIDITGNLDAGKILTGAARYSDILVDEFQDVNALDLSLLIAVGKYNNAPISLVGDDDQAIFEWRGATPTFILDPEKFLGANCATHILETNYRSPRNIVEHSQLLIKKNLRRVDKKIQSAASNTAKIRTLRMPTLTASIEFVVRLVKEEISKGRRSTIALIGRKRSQIIPYQIVFASENIEFYAAEDLQVFLSKAFNELKEMILIQQNVKNASSSEGQLVAILMKLCDKVKKYPLSKNDGAQLRNHLFRARPKSLADGIDAILKFTGSLKGENKNGRRSEEFASAIYKLGRCSTVATAIDTISTEFSGLRKDYGKSVEDIFYTDPPFTYLSDYARRYDDQFDKFCDDIDRAIATLARLDPEDLESEFSSRPGQAPLHLMTALRAKGKEYDTVIILDANSGIWPSKLADTPDQLEQERRLFYVAFTRARREVVVLVNDFIFGEPAIPSPYLQEAGLTISPPETLL